MHECRFCKGTNLEKRYRSVQDHPGYEVLEFEYEDGTKYEAGAIDGKEIDFLIRSNNTWDKNYPGDPYYCNDCKITIFIEEVESE